MAPRPCPWPSVRCMLWVPPSWPPCFLALPGLAPGLWRSKLLAGRWWTRAFRLLSCVRAP
eukprot:3734336-Alexandrium_andersonii.AAC.1